MGAILPGPGRAAGASRILGSGVARKQRHPHRHSPQLTAQFLVADSSVVTNSSARPPPSRATSRATSKPCLTRTSASTDGRSSLQTRDSIGQAKGILVSHFAMDPDEAFPLLVRLSQNTNTKLADLAADLVALVRDRNHRDPNTASATVVFDGLLEGTRRRSAETWLHRTGAVPR